MSGGYFYISHFGIIEEADEIGTVIRQNDSAELDDYGDPIGRGYSPEVLERLREAEATLRRAAIMLNRVDYLLSGDDGPESFLKRWGEELNGPIA